MFRNQPIKASYRLTSLLDLAPWWNGQLKRRFFTGLHNPSCQGCQKAFLFAFVLGHSSCFFEYRQEEQEGSHEKDGNGIRAFMHFWFRHRERKNIHTYRIWKKLDSLYFIFHFCTSLKKKNYERNKANIKRSTNIFCKTKCLAALFQNLKLIWIFICILHICIRIWKSINWPKMIIKKHCF